MVQNKISNMTRFNKFRISVVALILIITTMTVRVNSQNLPAFDQIGTAAGNVEMHFIGHGSLMFKLNDKIVYVDPVKSSGNYDNLPQSRYHTGNT